VWVNGQKGLHLRVLKTHEVVGTGVVAQVGRLGGNASRNGLGSGEVGRRCGWVSSGKGRGPPPHLLLLSRSRSSVPEGGR
jgi:hypothetical protein